MVLGLCLFCLSEVLANDLILPPLCYQYIKFPS
jgi:hypothetical protein